MKFNKTLDILGKFVAGFLIGSVTASLFIAALQRIDNKSPIAYTLAELPVKRGCEVRGMTITAAAYDPTTSTVYICFDVNYPNALKRFAMKHEYYHHLQHVKGSLESLSATDREYEADEYAVRELAASRDCEALEVYASVDYTRIPKEYKKGVLYGRTVYAAVCGQP